MICGSFTLGRLFDLISVHFWFNGALYFFFKNLFCGKVSHINNKKGAWFIHAPEKKMLGYEGDLKIDKKSLFVAFRLRSFGLFACPRSIQNLNPNWLFDSYFCGFMNVPANCKSEKLYIVDFMLVYFSFIHIVYLQFLVLVSSFLFFPKLNTPCCIRVKYLFDFSCFSSTDHRPLCPLYIHFFIFRLRLLELIKTHFGSNKRVVTP